MSKLLLTALASAILGAAALSNADAGGYAAYRDELGWGGYMNGTLVTGIALENASTWTVGTLTLPSGEIVELH